MKKLGFLAVVVIAFIASSCFGGSDSAELTRVLTSTHNFSVVQQHSTLGQYMVDRGPNYTLKINVTDQTLTLSVDNLRYWTDKPVSSFRVKDIPFKYDTNGAIDVSLDSVPSEGAKVSMLRLSYLERTDGEISLPAWDIEFDVAGDFHVRTVQDIVALFGEATVGNFTTEAPYYQLFFDPMSLYGGDMAKGYLIMYGAKFDDSMPAMNLKVYFSAKFTIGGFAVNSTEPLKVYTLDGNTEIEQPEYTLTNVSCGGNFDLSGSNKYPYYFDVTVGGKYDLGLKLGYTVPQSWMRPEDMNQ